MKEEKVEDGVKEGKISLMTVYDNYQHTPELKTGRGFGCLVRVGEKTILFDTGGDSATLLHNLDKLDINPKEIDLIVLSHIHGDHVGGLDGVLEKNSNVTVYLPQSFPSSFKDKIKSKGAGVVEVSDSMKIMDNVFSTGEISGVVKEQALVIETRQGLIVLTGCAHPGVVSMVKKAKEIIQEDVYLVIGGFHLTGASDLELKQIINEFKDLGVKKAAPCHCSGDRTRELFKDEYGDGFIENRVGKIINIG